MTRWTAFVALACLTTTVVAEDWPQWRGPNRDGVWEVEGVVDKLPEGQIPLEWSVPVQPGYNGPTVAGGRVFLMDRVVEGRDQTERILCFDSKTGKELWKVEYDAPYKIGYTAGPRASVTIDGKLAYAVGAMGHFHCLDVASGDVVWKRDLNEDYQIQMPIWGIAASPLIFGKTVIQQVAGSDGACMVAFDKKSGEEVWRALDDRAGYSSPIVIEQAGKQVLVCWTGDSLSGLDPETGKVHWSHEMKPSRMPIGIASPVLDNGTTFVTSFYDGSLMVTTPAGSLSSKRIWRAVSPDEKKTAVAEVTVGSKLLTDGPFGIHCMISTPIVKNGYIYGFDSYGEFRCLEAATGRRIWEDGEIVSKKRWGMAHMVQQADRVWIFNDQGELMIAKLSPEGPTVLSRSQLINPTKVQLARRNGVTWSHPAYAEKSIFIRNDEKLVRASLAK